MYYNHKTKTHGLKCVSDNNTPNNSKSSAITPLNNSQPDQKAAHKAIEIIESSASISRLSSEPIVIHSTPPPSAPAEIPWALQQFFDGEIDLDVELSTRMDSMPVMSIIKFRSLGKNTGRGVATISAQDGSSTVIIDADKDTQELQLSFTYGSMLTLRFRLNELGIMDRTRWINLMKREEGGLTFLWGPSRWENDYVICVSRKYFTNLYAFSPNNFQAGIRMTPHVVEKLLNWLEGFWLDEPDDQAQPPTLLTW